VVLDCAISSLAFEKREVANSLTDNGMRFTWPESRHPGDMSYNLFGAMLDPEFSSLSLKQIVRDFWKCAMVEYEEYF